MFVEVYEFFAFALLILNLLTKSKNYILVGIFEFITSFYLTDMLNSRLFKWQQLLLEK